MAAMGLVHRDPEHFPVPEDFRPKRFLEDDPPAPGTWIPFGGGARRCIGAGFSLMEGTEILREALKVYNFQAPNPAPEPAKPRNVTLVPARGAEVVVTRR
jgi:cytochrome P450